MSTGNSPRPVDLGRLGGDLALGEVPDHLPGQVLVVGRLEIHVGSRILYEGRYYWQPVLVKRGNSTSPLPLITVVPS